MARVPFLLKEGLEVEGGASILGDLLVGAAGYVGTTDPIRALDIAGTTTSATAYPGIVFNGDKNYGIGYLGTGGNDSNLVLWNYDGTDRDMIFARTTNGDLRFDNAAWTHSMVIKGGTGRVGIGIGAPASLLDVRGTVQVGVDGTGHDVKFFGDTATNGYMLWDQDRDDLILGSSSKIGIGITNPVNQLVCKKGTDELSYMDGSSFFGSRNYDGVGSPVFQSQKSRGSYASPTAVVSGDVLWSGGGAGYDGSNYKSSGSMSLRVDGSVAANQLGTRWNFYTNVNTSGNADTNALRMSIKHDGKVGIGSHDPASLLDVRGTVQVGENDLGHDVTFYGATSGQKFWWDQANGRLMLTDDVQLRVGTGGDMVLYHNGSHSYFTNATGDLIINTTSGSMNLAAETSGIAVNIGHGTSVTTIGDNLTVTDTITELSMREMKTNIEPIENILPSVLQMQGVQFDWKDEEEGINHYGFIAEDVDKILPNLVSHDSEGKAQGIQYTKMTAVLLEAIKEQQIQIDELKSKIN